MESAFTGLVRKHRVPFKPNRSITSHRTFIIVLLGFFRPCVHFSARVSSACLALFVSPTLAVPAAPSVLVLANATGIKE